MIKSKFRKLSQVAMDLHKVLATISLMGVIFIGQTGIAAAQDAYPRKSIRIVVPFAPGGTADILARIVAQEASKAPLDAKTSWQFYVENITGGGGLVGAQTVARAAPDGYTFLLCHIGCAIGHHLSGYQGWDPATAIIPVILVGNSPNILVTGPSITASTLSDFLALARSKPGKLSMASSGPGSSSHLSGELLRAKASIELLDVPYRGSSGAMPDLLSGRVDSMIMGLPESLPFVREGKLKALGVTSDSRVASLPNVPTIAEAGVRGYSFPGWLSIFAPAGTPADIVMALNILLDKTIKSPPVLRAFSEQSIQPGGGPPKIAGDLFRADVELWPQLLKARNPR